MKTSNQKNIFILSFILFVVMLGFGLVIPIMPFYVEELGAGGTELGLLLASYATMRLIFGPIWGNLSDRVGRKPILMVGMLGYAITMIWFGLATKLWMLFLARSLSGILSSATSPTTMAYISDNTTEKERSRGMGILGAAIGLGTIIGPGLGGILVDNSTSAANYSLPFFIAGGAAGLAVILIAILLPESSSSDSITDSESKRTAKLSDLWKSLKSPLGNLLVLAFITAYALTSYFGIFGLYSLEKFQFGPKEVGLILMVIGLVSAISQGLLTGPLSERWGDSGLIKVSLASTILTLLAITFSNSPMTYLVTTAFFTLSTALLSPVIQSLASKNSIYSHGFTMGLSNSYQSLGRIFGPLIAGFLFDNNIEFPLYLAALVVAAGLVRSFAPQKV
ncbi:MAG: MFS transporter [Anaerolineaceae bacterium]|nr:MFS transporter [Anaerolineaceae bacterium]